MDASQMNQTARVWLFYEVFSHLETSIEELAPVSSVETRRELEQSQDNVERWFHGRRWPFEHLIRDVDRIVSSEYGSLLDCSKVEGAAFMFGLIVHAARAIHDGEGPPINDLNHLLRVCCDYLIESGLFQSLEYAESSSGWRRAILLYDKLVALVVPQGERT